jgi:hypothetical protein
MDECHVGSVPPIFRRATSLEHYAEGKPADEKVDQDPEAQAPM